ncbi:MAG: TolC family protein [Gammaproteobacteria bacterium]|nr:TolC family protein [Gammaproteobacteria bacterium]
MSLQLRALGRRRTFVRGVLLPSALIGAAGLLAWSAATTAAAVPLTLGAALHYAVERSRQLSGADSAVLAAREMAVAAGQLPDPVLKFGLDSWPVNGPHRFSVGDDDFTMGRVSLSQEWTRAEKRQLRTQRFEREGEKTLAEKTVAIAAIERDTAIAWLDRYYAEAMAAVIAEQRQAVELEIAAADSAYRGGSGGQADVIAARSARAELADSASEIDSRGRAAKANLARWVGDAAELPLAGKPALDSVSLDKHTLETQLAHHPEVAVLAKQEALAETEAKLAVANKRADWSVELAYAQRGSAFSDFASVSVSIPLQWDQGHRQDREVAAKLALAEQATAEREEAVRSHVGAVLAEMQAWENGRERLARYARELIPLANARIEATLAAYRGGKANASELSRARRDEIDVRLRALQLERDTARLWAQLNFLFPEESAHASAPVTVSEESK